LTQYLFAANYDLLPTTGWTAAFDAIALPSPRKLFSSSPISGRHSARNLSRSLSPSIAYAAKIWSDLDRVRVRVRVRVRARARARVRVRFRVRIRVRVKVRVKARVRVGVRVRVRVRVRDRVRASYRLLPQDATIVCRKRSCSAGRKLASAACSKVS
jgi:hypothetical protein